MNAAGPERALRFSASDPEGAAAALRRHGLVIVDGLWPAQRIDRFAGALAQTYPEIFDARQKGLDQTHVVGELRHISPIVFGGDLACRDMVLHPQIESLLRAPLGDDYVFEALGVIQSLPGAPRQHRHADGSPLFGLPQLDRIAPAFAITVVIPLVAMDSRHGTTGFWPGSHLAPDAEEWSDADMVAPLVPVGSAILWDYRVKHCGLANRGDRVRPLLYVTACRPFWIDAGNFERGRDLKLLVDPAVLDGLGEQHRGRFARAQLFAAGERPWRVPGG